MSKRGTGGRAVAPQPTMPRTPSLSSIFSAPSIAEVIALGTDDAAVVQTKVNILVDSGEGEEMSDSRAIVAVMQRTNSPADSCISEIEQWALVYHH